MNDSNKNSVLLNEKNQPKLVRPRNIFRLIIILSVLCMTTFYCGYTLAYIIALGAKNLTAVYGSDVNIPVVKAFLIGSLPIGIAVGTFISPYIIPLMQRRNLTLVLSFLAQIIEFVIQIENIPAFFVCRSLQGIVIGVFMALVPIYIREISPKQINKKGIFGLIGNLYFIAGFMVSFGLSIVFAKSGTSDMLRWRLMISLNFILMLIIIVCVFTNIIPESPNDCIARGDHEKAKQIIKLFHHQNFVEQLYAQKIKQIEDGKKPPAPAANRPFVKTFLAYQIPIMHQMTGANAYLAQMGFVTAAFNNNFGDYVPFMMGAVQVIAAFYSMIYLYRIKRRLMILIGNLTMGLCCIGLGICFIYINETFNVFWIVVTLIVLLMGLNGATLIPSVWLYVAQIGTKQEIRYSQVTNWSSCSLSIVVFILIQSYFGFAPMFFTFGVITLGFFVINYISMVETKQDMKVKLNIELNKINLNMEDLTDRSDKI